MRTFFLVFLLIPLFVFGGFDFEFAAQEIIHAGRFCERLGIGPGFCNCFSHRIDCNRIAITIPGRHKGELQFNDIFLLDLNTVPRSNNTCDDFFLHACLFNCCSEVGAILHSHSVNSIELSLLLAGESVLKIDWANALIFGACCHQHRPLVIPIFDNCLEAAKIVSEISTCSRKKRNVLGFLIRGHGFFTWGCDMHEARHRIEAFEKLFEVELRLRCCRTP